MHYRTVQDYSRSQHSHYSYDVSNCPKLNALLNNTTTLHQCQVDAKSSGSAHKSSVEVISPQS